MGSGRPAPAVWVGYQDWNGLRPPTELYNLTEEIVGHPRGSTVSRETLEANGFDVSCVPLEIQPPRGHRDVTSESGAVGMVRSGASRSGAAEPHSWRPIVEIY